MNRNSWEAMEIATDLVKHFHSDLKDFAMCVCLVLAFYRQATMKLLRTFHLAFRILRIVTSRLLKIHGSAGPHWKVSPGGESYLQVLRGLLAADVDDRC